MFSLRLTARTLNECDGTSEAYWTNTYGGKIKERQAFGKRSHAALAGSPKSWRQPLDVASRLQKGLPLPEKQIQLKAGLSRYIDYPQGL